MRNSVFFSYVWLVAIGLLVMGSTPVAAQEVAASRVDSAQGATPIVFADGVAAMQDGDERQAEQLLQRVMSEDPNYLDESEGSAAYWLGKAYAANGKMDRAIQTWRLGLIALNEDDQFEVRLADAYIRHVFRRASEPNYRLATDAYVRMLRQLDDPLGGEEAAVLSQYLAHLVPFLPDAVKQEAGVTEARIKRQDLGRVKGGPIVTWWRSEDPMPATLENERVIEHLERVAYAQEHFAQSERLTGFDERGDIYLRYGAPKHREVVRFNESRLTDEIFRPGLSINLSDFPMNEFWSYGDIDRSGYYLFVEGDEGYQIGQFDELLPRQLRSGFSSTSERGRRRAYLSLSAMRAMYRRLSPYHPDLAVRHDEIANYLAQVTDVGVASRNEVDPREAVDAQISRGATFAERTVRENRNRDEVAARIRQKNMPQQSTRVFRDQPALDIAARTARFLEDDGTTRTEIYWCPAPDALRLSDDQRDELEEQGHDRFDQYIVRLTAAQKNAAYQSRILNRKHYRIGDIHQAAGRTIPTQTLQVRGDTALHHLSLQWDQYLVARNEQGEAQVGPRVKVATMRRDSVRALINDDRVLEMSDLRVMVLPPEVAATAVEEAIPYPFAQINPDMTLVLYFEAYHLAFTGEDQTRYSIEYEVRRQENDGRLVRLFTDDDPRSTATEATYEGGSRTAKEYIMLDLSDWEGSDDLRVTVRVTDEATGQQVERSVDLEAAGR